MTNCRLYSPIFGGIGCFVPGNSLTGSDQPSPTLTKGVGYLFAALAAHGTDNCLRVQSRRLDSLSSSEVLGEGDWAADAGWRFQLSSALQTRSRRVCLLVCLSVPVFSFNDPFC